MNTATATRPAVRHTYFGLAYDGGKLALFRCVREGYVGGPMRLVEQAPAEPRQTFKSQKAGEAHLSALLAETPRRPDGSGGAPGLVTETITTEPRPAMRFGL